MTDTVEPGVEAAKKIALLEKKLARQVKARNEAESIAEKSTRDLYETVRKLEGSNTDLGRMKGALEEQLSLRSTPLLEIWEGVLALPIIGIVDSSRAAEIMERLLDRIVSSKCKYVILDLTGVELVDTETANHFLKMIRAVQLLGTRGMMTGIRPAVAQTIVTLGMDLSAVATFRNLQDGLKVCLAEMGTTK